MPFKIAARLAALPIALAACVPVVVPIPLSTSSVQEAPARAAPRDLGRPPASARCAAPAGIRTARAKVLSAVNRERRARGLAAVTPDRRLRAAAQGQACDNAARGSYSHTGSDGSDLSVRVKRAGFPLRLAVENTARGFDSPERLVAYWMGSPGHRANILNPRTRGFGLGLAAPPGDRPHWVLVMGRAL